MRRFRSASIITVILLIAMVFSSCAEGSSEGRLSIVTTLFPQYDLAKHITGEFADVTLLLTPGAESHSYEPTPKDILKIQNADMFICVGGESEVWVDEVLSSAKNDDLRVMQLIELVDPIEEEHDDHESGRDFDEHIFTSLRNTGMLLDKICEEVCKIDAQNESAYKKNAEEYGKSIADLDTKFTELTQNAERKTLVFGDRYPFAYFAADYGLDCYGAFTGCGSETEASSAAVAGLIDVVKKENIPIVFYIEFSNHVIADKIADAAGVGTALLHSCHNISAEELSEGTSYVDLMTRNYETLSEALK